MPALSISNIKNRIINFIKLDKDHGKQQAIEWLDVNKIILKSDMLTQDSGVLLLLHCMKQDRAWHILIKKITKARMANGINKFIAKSWSRTRLIKEITNLVVGQVGSHIIKKVLKKVKHILKDKFTPWPLPLLPDLHEGSSAKRRRVADSTINKDNLFIPKFTSSINTNKKRKNKKSKKSDVADQEKNDQNKSMSVKSFLTDEDEDADSELEILGGSDAKNGDKDEEKDDSKDESGDNTNNDSKNPDEKILSELGIDPFATASSSSAFTILGHLLPSFSIYHPSFISHYYSNQFSFNNLALFNFFNVTISRWKIKGIVQQELDKTKSSNKANGSNSKISRSHIYHVESSIKKFLSSLSVKKTIKKFGIKGHVFSQERLKMINDNHELLRHNTFWEKSEDYFRNKYISKYKDDPHMSYEYWIEWMATLVKLPATKKQYESNIHCQGIFKDPFKANKLLSDIFGKLDDLNIEGLQFRQHVE